MFISKWLNPFPKHSTKLLSNQLKNAIERAGHTGDIEEDEKSQRPHHLNSFANVACCNYVQINTRNQTHKLEEITKFTWKH